MGRGGGRRTAAWARQTSGVQIAKRRGVEGIEHGRKGSINRSCLIIQRDRAGRSRSAPIHPGESGLGLSLLRVEREIDLRCVHTGRGVLGGIQSELNLAGQRARTAPAGSEQIKPSREGPVRTLRAPSAAGGAERRALPSQQAGRQASGRPNELARLRHKSNGLNRQGADPGFENCCLRRDSAGCIHHDGDGNRLLI